MVHYRTDLEGVTESHLHGFFEGWPESPDAATHLRILRAATHVVIAWEGERVVGFVTAISDGVLCAYVPLLEVLADYRGRGIGSALIDRVRESARGLYMVDAICDETVRPFYEAQGFMALRGMALRDRAGLRNL